MQLAVAPEWSRRRVKGRTSERQNMLDDTDRQIITTVLDAFCEARVPIMVRDKVVLQYRIHRHDVVLFERRPRFTNPAQWTESAVAKFRLNKTTGTWSLLWRDRNSRWHRYERCGPAPDLETLVKEVDADPTGIFWG